MIGLPEILFNLFPGMGAYSLLARRTSPRVAEELILSGKLLPAAKLHEMGGAISCRKLHQTETITDGVKTQRFGIDGDCRPKVEIVGQIALVQPDFHAICLRKDGEDWRDTRVSNADCHPARRSLTQVRLGVISRLL